jgi:hypothetical protein
MPQKSFEIGFSNIKACRPSRSQRIFQFGGFILRDAAKWELR